MSWRIGLKHIRTQVGKQLDAACPAAAEAMAETIAEVAQVGRDLASACLPYEEWEVLFRQMLMMQRDILQAGRPSRPAFLKAGVAGSC